MKARWLSYLFHVDFKRSERLTLWTGAWFHLLILGLKEGAQDEVTLVTVVFDHSQLWKNSCAAGHHTAGTDQLVQMKLPKKKKKKEKRFYKMCQWEEL